MPSVLTHDHAIAQKENPRKRRHHDRSRSEDEKKLTIAEDLPAEVPLLPCTSLVARNNGLRFPSPKKRRRKVESFDDSLIKSRKRLKQVKETELTQAPVVQSPERIGAGNDEIGTSDPSSPRVRDQDESSIPDNDPDYLGTRKTSLRSSITTAEEDHLPKGRSLQESVLTETLCDKPCYQESEANIPSQPRGGPQVFSSPQSLQQAPNNSLYNSPDGCQLGTRSFLPR